MLKKCVPAPVQSGRGTGCFTRLIFLPRRPLVADAGNPMCMPASTQVPLNFEYTGSKGERGNV